MLISVCAWCGQLKLWRWHVPIRIETTHGICSRCRTEQERRWREKMARYRQ